MLVDLLSLLISFTAVFFVKFEGFWFLSGFGWSNIIWARLALLFVSADVVLTYLLNPYSGIFKREYYMEIIRSLQLAAFNAISVALVLYVFKIGIDYSRTVFIMTYVIYFFLSVLLKYIWKRLIVSGRIKAYETNKTPLFIVTQKALIDSVIRDINADDYVPYEIRGIHFVDDSTISSYQEIPVSGAGFADDIIRQHIGDVLIALSPHLINQQDYQKLIDNAVNIHISIERTIGVQTEDQFLSEMGVCKTLSMTAFSFRPSQLLYLIFKRLLDILFGLIGLIVLIPVTAIVKIAYLASGDKAKIFYTQKRIGQDGKTIRI
ncbi:MAG: sugar transferase, partial [Oscillospiraceae bacterium]|nr:sugar transferase [Oscillospiraceae bacterium]